MYISIVCLLVSFLNIEGILHCDIDCEHDIDIISLLEICEVIYFALLLLLLLFDLWK